MEIYMESDASYHNWRFNLGNDTWTAHTFVSGGYRGRLVTRSRSYNARHVLQRVAESFTKSELESVSSVDVSIRTGKTLNIILEGGVSDDNSC